MMTANVSQVLVGTMITQLAVYFTDKTEEIERLPAAALCVSAALMLSVTLFR